MGSEGRAHGPVAIVGRVVGTGPIERVDVFRGLEIVRTVSPYAPASFEGSPRYRIAWAGSRVRGRDRLTTWDGHLELSEGRIVDAVMFAMENPEKGIVERTDARVRFVSNTTGDDDGIDVTLDAPAGAVIRFRTPVIDLDVPLADLRQRRHAHLPRRRHRSPGLHAPPARSRPRARDHLRARRPIAAAGHLPRVLDPRHAGGRRPGLDQPGLPPGRREGPICFVGALVRALNVERLRLAPGLRAPPRSWTLLAGLAPWASDRQLGLLDGLAPWRRSKRSRRFPPEVAVSSDPDGRRPCRTDAREQSPLKATRWRWRT